MSFQAYLNNIKTRTGKTPEDFKKLLQKEKLLNPDLRPSDLVNYLKKNFDSGNGHLMAMWAVFKSNGRVQDPRK